MTGDPHAIVLWDTELNLFRSVIEALIRQERSRNMLEYLSMTAHQRIAIGGVEFSAYIAPPLNECGTTSSVHTIVRSYGESAWLLRIPQDRNPCGCVPREGRLWGDPADFNRDLVLLKMFLAPREDSR